MTVHLLKTAVGVPDLDHLRQRQDARLGIRDGREVVLGFTRNKPKRLDELIAGGSIYWIIKGRIQARQRVLGLADAVDDSGRFYCELHLDPHLIETNPVRRRAIQGWRYLSPAEAPADLDIAYGVEGEEELPAHLARELRELGLL
jgi:hypothetical protein